MEYKLFDLQMFADTKVPANLVKKVWAAQLWKEAQKDNFFAKFTGTGTDSIIQKVTQLSKEKGDKITIPLMMRLTGDPIMGDAMLEGKEEALTFYDYAVTINQFRHAVRLEGEMEEQKTIIDLRTAAKDGLKTWLTEYIEAQIVKALTASPTASHVKYAGSASSEGDISASDIITTDLISAAARLAKTMSPKIRRPKVQGKEYYVLLVDPYMARDLKKDEKWLMAQKYCAERGIDNPLFSGMLGVWDGVVLHEYENLIRTNTGASSAMVGHGLLLGCQAGVQAIGKEPYWREKAFDYDNKVGFAVGGIMGFGKAKFNEKDFGVVQIIASSAND